MITDSKKWYAVYTNPRSEKKVVELLNKKGFENYCPLHKLYKQWSDRKKIILVPLFTSYVFVRIDSRELALIRQIHGVVNFVYWLNRPAIIRNEEIEIIKKFLNDYNLIRLEKVAIQMNDVVKIISGAFMEHEGHVVSIKNKTVKVILPSLGYWMHAEIEIANVKVIQENSIVRKDLAVS